MLVNFEWCAWLQSVQIIYMFDQAVIIIKICWCGAAWTWVCVGTGTNTAQCVASSLPWKIKTCVWVRSGQTSLWSLFFPFCWRSSLAILRFKPWSVCACMKATVHIPVNATSTTPHVRKMQLNPWTVEAVTQKSHIKIIREIRIQDFLSKGPHRLGKKERNKIASSSLRFEPFK